jgi:hypothetical protein
LIKFGPCAGTLETAITHPTGITAGNGCETGTQPGSKADINKKARVTNKYIGLIFHSRGNLISSAAAYASSLYHFQTHVMEMGLLLIVRINVKYCGDDRTVTASIACIAHQRGGRR